MGKTLRGRRKKVYTSPEREKNGRKRRRMLLQQSETGKKWRYGRTIERLEDG